MHETHNCNTLYPITTNLYSRIPSLVTSGMPQGSVNNSCPPEKKPAVLALHDYPTAPLHHEVVAQGCRCTERVQDAGGATCPIFEYSSSSRKPYTKIWSHRVAYLSVSLYHGRTSMRTHWINGP